MSSLSVKHDDASGRCKVEDVERLVTLHCGAVCARLVRSAPLFVALQRFRHQRSASAQELGLGERGRAFDAARNFRLLRIMDVDASLPRRVR